MTQSFNNVSEFPYAEAATGSAKRTSLIQQGALSPWTTSTVESTTVCTKDKVFAIGGFDVYKQRTVSHARMWDSGTRVWTRMPDAPFRVAHASAAAVPGEGSVVLFGGWEDEKCSAELWYLHPRRPGSTAVGVGEVSPPGRGEAAGGDPTPAPASARGRPSKGDGEAALQWDRLEADTRVSSRPVGRHGHALASGVSSPKARWQTSPPSPPAAESLQLSDESLTPGAATVLSGVPTVTGVEPVLYLFGGSDTASLLNDVWRLWLAPSIQRRVAYWERLEVARGVSPCPREDAVLAFDASRQSLWLYGGRTATGILDDIWYLSLTGESSSSGLTWTPVQVLGGHPLGPTRRNLSKWCMPAAAAVEDGSLYVLFSDTSMSAKRLYSNGGVPLYRFCLTTHQWLSFSLSEEEAASSRSSNSQQALLTLAQHANSFRFVASCACNRFLFWLKESADDEAINLHSTPTVVHVELNVPATKTTKRRTDRTR
ncbi:putative Kelch motif containing protein [Leishmania shawi]|uniref:Kelch motif containing protein n=1 Tax=Leishmania shawi TaxID=5680 RepID=A0AAW3B7S1_9TRYP